MTSRVCRVLVGPALVVLGGCSILEPQRLLSRFYVLTAAGAEPAVTAAATAPGAIGLGPVTLPRYLDRAEIATRVAASELRYSTVDRWAEPLSAGVQRVLLEDLARRLGVGRVVAYPWPRGAVSGQIAVDVRRFDASAGGDVALAVRWEVRDRMGRLVDARDESLTRASDGQGMAGTVAAMSGALDDLSGVLAQAVGRLPAEEGRR